MRDSQRVRPDATLCRDCQACTLACSLYHEGECNLSLARLAVSKDMARYAFSIVVCRQCESPACVEACPNQALRRDERGVVMIFQDECLQCGACLEACPYDALFYSGALNRYFMCDLCAGREEGALCVALCPVSALTLTAEHLE
jgi:carbon-monoxide dehydrogenase iron sulfur subunit